MFKTVNNLLSQKLFVWINREKQEAMELALKAEAYVLQLNDLTIAVEERGELVSILKSTCLLLQRLIKRKELLQTPLSSRNQVKTMSNSIPPLSTAESSVSLQQRESELSAIFQEIIKLRDWVLLARKSKPEADTEVLTAIDRQLEQILRKEDIVCFEETGTFDCKQQKIVATQITDDPQQSDRICHTVRPGYLFRGELIRPQEVIIYVFQSSNN